MNGNKLKLIRDRKKLFKTPKEIAEGFVEVDEERRKESLLMLEKLNGCSIEELKKKRNGKKG